MSADPIPQIPDPNGPPVAAPLPRKLAQKAVKTTLAFLVGGVAAFVALGTASTRTLGALRSTRIKWQERRAEIVHAQGASASGQTPATQPGDSGHD